jgi:hypothetical protein
MSFNITVHFDNSRGLHNPHLFRWNDGSSLTDDLEPAGTDAFGVFYNLDVVRSEFRFKFKAGPGLHGPWEDDSLNRFYSWLAIGPGRIEPAAIWCKGDKAFVYDVEPRAPESISAEAFIAGLPLNPKVFIPDTGGRSGLGATVLADGTVLFGLYHPNAVRVYVMGDFNDWQRPGVEHPDPSKFIELRLYRGYFNIPNLWLGVTDVAAPVMNTSSSSKAACLAITRDATKKWLLILIHGALAQASPRITASLLIQPLFLGLTSMFTRPIRASSSSTN